MELYCAVKNTGPTWTGPDPTYMLYLGTSLEEAILAVGDFVKYEKPIHPNQLEHKHVYSALPKDIDFTIERYYMADGWWRTVLKFEIN